MTPLTCPQSDAVCMSLTGQTPAPAIDYIAVSAAPFAGVVEIVAVVLAFVVVMLALRALVIWSRDA